jgi:methylated-DNA-[protein]-cysteine S-methyltransferase
MVNPVTSNAGEAFGLDRVQTPIGVALLVTDAAGQLCALDWEDYEPRMHALLRLQHGAVVQGERPAPRELRAALSAYFNGELGALRRIRWRLGGTSFQRKVWTALADIAPGTTMSYGALAASLGAPKAMRAVGHANGANPLSVVIPCHRLIGANGALVKYGGGLHRKRWLLEHEGVAVGEGAKFD